MKKTCLLLSIALCAVTALSACGGGGGTSAGLPASPSPRTSVTPLAIPLFGVLEGDTAHIQTDFAAGVREVELDVSWNLYEPTEGSYSASYKQSVVSKVQAYRSDGFAISISPGLQYTPGWVQSNAALQLQSQIAGDYSGVADLEFDQSLRDDATSYIADLVKTLGPVYAYRVGLSQFGETLYPPAPNAEWWAFNPIAQGDAPGRPSTIPTPPLPHWVPGTLYNGQAVTKAQAQSWYDWYFNALVDGHAWEIGAFRQAGFTGPIHLPMPGNGARPDAYASFIASGLATDPSDTYHVMNTAAVWFLFLDRLLPKLSSKANIVVDISSVDDTSGLPRANGCAASDASVAYLTDPQVDGWSSTRWVSFNAKRNGLAITGENPGSNSNPDMQIVIGLMQQCGLSGIQWAFDDQLYDGTHATIATYAGLIEATGTKR